MPAFIYTGFKHPAIKFILSVLVLYFIWDTVYVLWLMNSEFSIRLCHLLAKTTSGLFSLFGIDSATHHSWVSIGGKQAIGIGTVCNGLDFFGLFTCFVLAFPAPWPSKLWFLPAGILLIFLLNLLRIQVLIVNYVYYQSSFEFNHHYTFNLFVYGAVLIVWLAWAKREMKPVHV
jgi:exosortase family protein XrtF